MRRLVALIAGTLAASALAWTAGGGMHAAGQTPGPTGPTGPTGSPGAEIHRAHAGSLAPDLTKTVFILVLGSDAGAPGFGRGGPQDRGRADSIHILAINPQRRAASIVGIPRDAFVPMPGFGSRKITGSLAFGGPSLAVRTVEGLTGIRFDYYMLTNFDDFVAMATEFGGLTINVPFAMRDPDSRTNWGAGVRHLSGQEVLGFTRNRHNAPRGDFDRSLNQGRVMVTAQATARKRVAEDPTSLLQFLWIMRRHILTDIPFTEQLRLGMAALKVDPANVQNVVVPGSIASTSDGSSVVLTEGAYQIFRNVKDDGVLTGG